MSTRLQQIPILLFKAAEHFFGVDAESIVAIGDSRGVLPDLMRDIMTLFGAPASTRSSAIVVADGRTLHGLMVDEVHGVQSIVQNELHVLSRSLRQLTGMQDWVLGSLWHRDRLVWLLDLEGAVCVSAAQDVP
ncbi:MAG: hypothetical protein R3C68_09150 [Myxococcota bacterium]